jgi:L-malate glycosyltransferase
MKPNVLQLIDSFNQGGTERQTVQLTRLLHESGRYNIYMGCLSAAGPLRQEIERLGVTNIPEYPLNSFYDWNAVKQVRRFAKFLKEKKIDIVHVHDFYTNIFGMAGAALASVPVRIASRRETDGIRSQAQRFVERRGYDLAHAIVANAEAVRAQLIKEGIRPDKIVTLYNGVDLERLMPKPNLTREEALDAFNLPREERTFITIVANMHHPMKDQATFLRAASRVHKEIPKAGFILAGEGKLLESLRELANQLGLKDHAFFTGRCTKVSELLAISDVCVLSSKGVEGFSNSIIEYMAAEKPVVATDIGGAREAILEGETGYIVNIEDDQAMADRIISLLRNPEQARLMGARGRRLVQEKFSCAAQLENIEQLYDGLLSRKQNQGKIKTFAYDSKSNLTR